MAVGWYHTVLLILDSLGTSDVEHLFTHTFDGLQRLSTSSSDLHIDGQEILVPVSQVRAPSSLLGATHLGKQQGPGAQGLFLLHWARTPVSAE